MAIPSNLVKCFVSGTPGVGTITLGAAVSPFFGASELVAGSQPYTVIDGANVGTGHGTFNGTTLTRDPAERCNVAGVSQSTPMSLTSAAVVLFTPLQTDIAPQIGECRSFITAPSSEWLKRDGASYSQSSKAALYAKLGLIADVGPQVLRSGVSVVTNRACIYANSLFVAVGDNGNIETSADGITWTTRTSNTLYGLAGIIYANSLFVAWGAGGAIVTSSDGVTWTARTSNAGNNAISQIVYANSLFVAVGNAGKISTSPDGLAWTARTSGVATNLTGVAYDGSSVWAVSGLAGVVLSTTTPTSTWNVRTTSTVTDFYGMAFGNANFVAWGKHEVAGDTRKSAWTSGDGTTWTGRIIDAANQVDMSFMIYAGGQWIAYQGLGGRTYYASDPTGSWTAGTIVSTSSGSTTVNTMVAYDGTTYVIVGTVTSGQGVWTSTDGHAWTQRVFTFGTMNCIANGASKWVVMGSSGVRATSSDASTWVNRTQGTVQTLNFGVYGGSTYVVVGNAGTIIYSADLATWLVANQPTTQNLNGIAYGASTYVTVGNAGAIASSTDAVTWTSRTSGTTSNLNRVCFGNSLFVAVGAGGTLLTSSDGATWTLVAVPTPNALTAVIYANSLFVAVGALGTIITSSDGVTWTSRAPATSGGFTGVAYANSTFLAVDGQGTIFKSTNGTTWTLCSVPSAASSSGIAAGSAIFYIAGMELTTVDGSKFTPKVPNKPYPTTVVFYGNGYFIALGAGFVTTQSEYSYNTSTNFVVPNSIPTGSSDLPIDHFIYAGP